MLWTVLLSHVCTGMSLLYFGFGKLWNIGTVMLLLCLPPWNGETYCFNLCCQHVRLSVYLSHCRVHSISFETLVGFSNTSNSTQMLSMMRRCAVRMFDLVWFNVRSKFKVKHYDCIMCPLYYSWRVGDILKWVGTRAPDNYFF